MLDILIVHDKNVKRITANMQMNRYKKGDYDMDERFVTDYSKMGKVYSFTEEEIKKLEMKPSDIWREKIEACNNEEALNAFDAFAAMFTQVHDTLGRWITYVMSALYKEAGEEATEKAMIDFLQPTWKMMSEHFWDMDFKERVIFSVNAAKNSHDVPVVFDGEDDEKIVFHMEPCGSGQKLREEGLYEEPKNLALCKAHRMTANIGEFPVYCVHAPLGDLCAIKASGHPAWVMDFANPVASCACKYIVYKRKEDIPEFYYTRLGLKKPE